MKDNSRFFEAILILIIAGLLLGSSGCGTTCEQLARQRDELLARTASTQSSTPHLVAAVPLELANELIRPEVAAIEPLELNIPSVGVLAQSLTNLTIRPREVELVPAEGEAGVGIELVLEIAQGTSPLFTMTARGVIQPELDAARGRVVVELGADDFREMAPRLAPDAVDRIVAVLERLVPGVARLFVSPRAIASAATMLTEAILTQSYPLVRDSLFSQLGPLARVEVALPNLPIERLEISSSADAAPGGAIVLGAYTPLAIERGVSVGQDEQLAEERRASLLLSGDAVAALANWAMAEGQLPSRFDEEGQAAEDGVFQPTLDWGSGERPLRVHVFRLEPRCLRALLTARPSLSVEEERLLLEVDDVRVDELEGPPFAGLVRLFARIWVRAIERTQSTAASLDIAIAGRPLQAIIRSAEREGDEVRMSLDFADRQTAHLNLTGSLL